MELVLKSAEANNQTLTEAEVMSRAQSWMELLFEVIRYEKDLRPAYNRAFLDNKTDFAINAQMVKNAYERMQKLEEYEQIKDYKANADDEWQCPYCFNCGWASIDRDGCMIPLQPQNQFRGVVKCYFRECDYWTDRLKKINK